MGISTTTQQPTINKSISVDELDALLEQRETFAEGSFEWIDLNAKINQIVAENYLRYLNG